MPKTKRKKSGSVDANANDNSLKDADVKLDYISRLTMATGIPTYKIILCGEYGVGKSSLFRRFMNDTFTPDADKRSSIGLDQAHRVYEVDGQQVKVCLFIKCLPHHHKNSDMCEPQLDMTQIVRVVFYKIEKVVFYKIENIVEEC